MSTPYRDPGAVAETKSYPRVVLGDDNRRLVQVSEKEFLIERKIATKDAMGGEVALWKMQKRVEAFPVDAGRAASFGIDTDVIHEADIAVWLCAQLARLTS